MMFLLWVKVAQFLGASQLCYIACYPMAICLSTHILPKNGKIPKFSNSFHGNTLRASFLTIQMECPAIFHPFFLEPAESLLSLRNMLLTPNKQLPFS